MPTAPSVAVLAALAASAAASDPPATVVDHTVVVRVDAQKRLVEEVTWTVRIEDPAACAAGVLAPPGLDGAAAGGAQVLEELLVVPSDTQVGSTFSLRAERRLDKAEHSGVFLTAPDMPTQHAELVVDVPTGTPLTVWADPRAVASFETKRSRKIRFEWTNLGRTDLAEAAWSTFEDWPRAGANVQAATAAKLLDKDGLGRTLAEGIEGLGVGGVTERVWATIALDPGPPGSWTSARPARDVVAARSGNAAERGLVLLSMLKVAGMDAEPAWFRPAEARGSFPVTVPAPTLLPRPVVVVHLAKGDVYVDPAAERVAVPDRPASLLGATLWVPGQLPARLPETGVTDGAVSIATTVNLSGDGSATFSAVIQATGAAQEYLRNLLGPLDEAARTESLLRLVRQGRPDLAALSVSATAVDRPGKPLKITVGGSDAAVLAALPYGLRGRIPPVLAPAMAAWLPPRVAIRELVSVTPPTTVQILGTAGPASVVHEDAIVGRGWHREGPKLTFETEVERPYRTTTPARDAAATAFLAERAREGVELLLFTTASGSTAKAVRTAEALDPGDRAVLEALLWAASGLPKKGVKALERAVPEVGFERLVVGLEHWSDVSDLAPWETLSGLAATDGDRIRVAEGLEIAGARQEAWLRATRLAESPDADARMRALLLMERLEGPEPAPGDAHAALWKPPIQLLASAADLAAKNPQLAAANRVKYRLAELQIEAGDVGAAEATLEQSERNALAEALLAYAGAVGGLPADEVRRSVDAAVRKDPSDAWLVAVASDALARVGDRDTAARYAVNAARIARTDPQIWALAGERALAAGDLPQAVDAARRASDLEPTSHVHAARWALLAELLLDREAVDAARTRAGMPAVTAWPPNLDERLALDAGGMLAVLETWDREVLETPRLLSMRAQMRIELGRLDDAARDGLVLALRHGLPEGYALAFAATAGRQYSTSAAAALDRAAKTELTAQVTRMEYRMVTATGDPLEDAKKLEDPRAAAVVRCATNPALVAAEIAGWPETVPKPTGAPPPGFRVNKLLSGPGWVGWSNPELGVAVVKVGTVTGLLPPPFAAMYTPRTQATRRFGEDGQVLTLDGGIIPLYAAVKVRDGQEIFGFGFTEPGAISALQLAAP